MIQISGVPFKTSGSLNLGSVENSIVKRMQGARRLYSFSSENEFLFEIQSRKNIMDSAKEMNGSQAVFTTFEYASCNPAYWNLTQTGGFQLRNDVRPSDAILDIYANSSLYAFECATACVIIFYRAVLNSVGSRAFDSVFQNLYLYSWHTDSDLGLNTFQSDDFLPGDVVYFNNPEYSRENPWYRGINAVVLTGGEFFGHGYGISSADKMIQFLNEQRKPESGQSAYITSLVTRPSFDRLFWLAAMRRNTIKLQPVTAHHNKTSISCFQYLYYLNKMMSSQ